MLSRPRAHKPRPRHQLRALMDYAGEGQTDKKTYSEFKILMPVRESLSIKLI